MTVEAGIFGGLAVAVVIILGYVLFKFLCTCKHFQADRRRPQREPDMAPQDTNEEMKETYVSVVTGNGMQAITLPPSYEQCVTSQQYLVNMAQPPSYQEYVSWKEAVEDLGGQPLGLDLQKDRY